YLPYDRIGNFAQRPLLRGYEIPILGRSGAPIERQIPLGDLTVSVEGDRVILRSRRLGCEVLPRLSNAHNFSEAGHLPVYRFLCQLQDQNAVGVTSFDFGVLESAPH